MQYYSLVVTALLAIFLSSPVQGQAIGDTLVFPTEITHDGSGLLDIELTIEYGDHTSAVYSMTNTRLLGGTLPGPTLKVKAGDEMRILFKNELTEQANRNTGHNEYGLPDTSNLHFHGAHVSGELPSDDVVLQVGPGEEYQYITHFPANHMPGTHWIHPHVHGSGALQVGGGAAMALIVEDEPGTLPSVVENAEDVLLFVQYMDMNQLPNIAATSGDEMLTVTRANGGGIPNTYRLVNGQYQPNLDMELNAWHRFRVVYASWLREPLDFSIDDPNGDCEMVWDGLLDWDIVWLVDMV